MMRFPEAEIRSASEFRDWYERSADYFDQRHTIQAVTLVHADNGTCDVDVRVRWQATSRHTSQSSSTRVDKIARQSWKVRDSTRNPHALEILVYDVSALEDSPNAAPADSDPRLVDLNVQIGEAEQIGGDYARGFFGKYLSESMIFRRASGTIVGKAQFLDDLPKNPIASRFRSR